MTSDPRGVRVLLNPSPSAPVPLELLRVTDLLILNSTETADFLFQTQSVHAGSDWASIGAELAQRGIDTLIVTLGGEGAVVLEGG